VKTTYHTRSLPDHWEHVLREAADRHTTTIRELAGHLGLPAAAVRNIVLALERRGLLARAAGVYDPTGHHDRLVIYATRTGRRWLRQHPARRQLSLAA
jgi:DNA-binding MarR family transcriptional regulator